VFYEHFLIKFYSWHISKTEYSTALIVGARKGGGEGIKVKPSGFPRGASDEDT